MTLVLRKSVGPFSAGTRVHVIDPKVSPGVVLVEPDCVPFDSDNYLEIHVDDLVERRNQEDQVPATNRAERRRFLNKLFNVASGKQP